MQDDPFLDPDDDARGLARDLLRSARHGALGVLLDGAPFVSRVALAPTNNGPLTLISDLAPHTSALRETPRASLMVGEPGKGDPLAHPRLTLAVDASFTAKGDNVDAYLAAQPKAQLYIGFADFHIVRFALISGHLNAGFGKAYRLASGDLIG